MTAGPVRADAAMRAVALAGIRSGKSMREIAVDLYGRARAAARAKVPIKHGATPRGVVRA